MKKYILLGILFTAFPLMATPLPDHPFFRAMQDEMQRSLQQLRMEGSPRPYYIVYKVDRNTRPVAVGSVFGEITMRQYNAPVITTNVLLSVGNQKQDSFGTEGNYWNWHRWVGNSYEDIRHALWDSTNVAYLRASRLYKNKQSYLRKKAVVQPFPDVIPGPQGTHVDEKIPEISVDASALEALAKRLGAQGKKYPFIEQLELWLTPEQYQSFWLNSLGAYAYVNLNFMNVDFDLSWHTKDGFERTISQSWRMNMQEEGWEQTLEKQIDTFLKNAQKMYEAKQGTAYIGPVLLSAPAAARLWQESFVKNMGEFGTLISADGKEKNSGSFKDKLGLRVVAPSIDVYDQPSLRTYNHQILAGFSPLDDEGVVPQELTLIKDGFLRDIPTSSRPFKKGIGTNGHGFAPQGFPREYLTNVVVEPHQPLEEDALEEKLLEMCRAQELEYGYILHGLNEGDNGVALAERIYVADGHKEPVYGLRIETDLGPRLLRDIRGAGKEKAVFKTDNSQTILSPALLLEEMELVPTDKKPDRKPFVPKP